MSSSAEDARKLGLLHRADPISMNPERLIGDAKELALSLVPDYSPGVPRTRHQSRRRKRVRAAEAGRVDRCARAATFSDYDVVGRREARERVERRPAHRRTDGQRAISARSGARSVPEPVRQSENAGAHAVYAEDRKAAKELDHAYGSRNHRLSAHRVGKAPEGTLAKYPARRSGRRRIRRLLEKYPAIAPEEIDDVILGCAMPEAESGMNMARIAALRAGLPDSVPGVTINRFCSSGLQAIAMAADRIRSGGAEIIIAGGAESMSMMPMAGNKFAPNPWMVDHIPQIYMGMGLTAEEV